MPIRYTLVAGGNLKKKGVKTWFTTLVFIFINHFSLNKITCIDITKYAL